VVREPFRQSRTSIICTVEVAEEQSRGVLKKAVQQGRSERRGEEVRTALRVGRSPFEWILARENPLQ